MPRRNMACPTGRPGFYRVPHARGSGCPRQRTTSRRATGYTRLATAPPYSMVLAKPCGCGMSLSRFATLLK